MSASGHDPSAFLRAMGPVARELLGEPNPRHSSNEEWRWGARGSLCVRLDKGTWFDNEAGSGGGVLDLVQQRAGLDRNGAVEWLRERGHLDQTTASSRRQVAVYDYTDERGELLFQVTRLDPKDFRQRRPDGRGGWTWKTAGVRRVLYRLPKIIEAVAAGRTVYIVEGEKAAQALIELGLDATCSPGGAGKWHQCDSAALAGADIIVLPDNDQPGRDHATAVARALAGSARRIRILELPGLPPKGDAADWRAAGGDWQQLEDLLGYAEDQLVTSATPAPDKESPYAPLRFVNPVSLFGIAIPQRDWIVEDWLPVGHTTINYGDGGVGKTLLAQQLATSCATESLWLGLAVTPCKVLFVACEDDDTELHRRQDAINQQLGLTFADLGGLLWASGVGADNTLAEFDHDGRMTLTRRLFDLEQAALDLGARLLILDTAADLFGGNENDRRQVRRFIGEALNSLARAIGGAVLLNAHPSRSGMASGGTGDGGSTAWNNTARSRWSLTRPDPDETGEVDPHDRLLTRRKANYASIGDTIRLRWSGGVLTPEGQASSAPPMFAAIEAETVFLRLLEEAERQGRPVSASPHAGSYAPRQFAKADNRRGLTRRELERAMERLFAAGRLQVVSYGKPSDDTRKIVAIDPPATVGATVEATVQQGATVGDGSEKSQ